MKRDPALKITLKTKDSSPKLPGRIDVLLLNELKASYPDLSRNRLKELFRSKKILANGRPVQGSLEVFHLPLEVTILEDLDELTSSLSSPSSIYKGPPISVIWEDEDIIVINKPSGIPSVPHSGEETNTAVNAVLAHLGRQKKIIALIGKGGLEPGILHRLDTGTSGLLVFAKNERTYEDLRTKWTSGQIRKHYRAIVRPSAKELKEGLVLSQLILPHSIDLFVAHDPKSTKRMIATRDRKRAEKLKAQSAITKILEKKRLKEEVFDLEVAIETGVMHQIRCHLSAIGWPIVGDPIYGGTPSSRLWLHAWQLSIPLKNGARLDLQAPLPGNWPGAK